MAEERVLIVACHPVGVQADHVILQLSDGAHWGIPIPIFNQYCHPVINEPVKESEELK